MKVGNKIKNYCSSCIKSTNHDVLYCVNVPEDDFDDIMNYFGVVKCMGCDNISYRTEIHNWDLPIPDESGESWKPTVTVNAFPKALRKHKKTIYKHHLPKSISVVYFETISAFSSECFLLTGVGFRAIIEAICIDKKIVGRDLNIKISNMVKSKLITEKEADRLHAIRFIGNDSIHDMKVLSSNALYIVLNIVEHLLNNLYIIDEKMKNKLPTIINNFKDFKTLLNEELNSKRNQVGESKSLSEILGKSSYRRIQERFIEFDSELKDQIDNEKYKRLSKGDLISNPDPKKVIQKYIITDALDEIEDYLDI